MNEKFISGYELVYKNKCRSIFEETKDVKELNNYDNFKDAIPKEIFKIIINKKQNRRQKRSRTKQKFKEILKLQQIIKNSEIYFGTLTLDNEHLQLKEDTYMRYISKWLKQHFIYVILNKDFGSKTEREHYHFIGLTKEEVEIKHCRSKKGYQILEFKNKNYELGFEPTLCKIDLKKDDIDKTTSYLLKLNNHSNKLGTKNRIRIYKNKYTEIFYKKTKQ